MRDNNPDDVVVGFLSELPPETQKTSDNCFHRLSRLCYFDDVSVQHTHTHTHTHTHRETCRKNGNLLLITWFHDLLMMNLGGGERFTVVSSQFSFISKGFNCQKLKKKTLSSKHKCKMCAHIWTKHKNRHKIYFTSILTMFPQNAQRNIFPWSPCCTQVQIASDFFCNLFLQRGMHYMKKVLLSLY